MRPEISDPTSVPSVAGAENPSMLRAFGRRKKLNRRVATKIPEKIVFSADDISSNFTTTPGGNSMHPPMSPFAFPLSLAVTSSFKEVQGALPCNILVTSVDLEEVPQGTHHKGCGVSDGRILCIGRGQSG